MTISVGGLIRLATELVFVAAIESRKVSTDMNDDFTAHALI